jgi:hypothetical protein
MSLAGPKVGGTKRVSDAGESIWRLSSIANSANTAKHVCAEWLACFEPERCKRCKASLRGFQIGLEQSVRVVRLASDSEQHERDTNNEDDDCD